MRKKINFAFVAGRWSNPFWQCWDLAMLWLADCYDRNGQPASAWAEFREAEAVATASKDPRGKIAHARVERLEPALARMTLNVAGSLIHLLLVLAVIVAIYNLIVSRGRTI